MTGPAKTPVLEAQFPWDDAALEYMRALYDNGDSHKVIAQQMTVKYGVAITKNVISGMVGRLKWKRDLSCIPGRKVAIAGGGPKKPKPPVVRKPKPEKKGFTASWTGPGEPRGPRAIPVSGLGAFAKAWTDREAGECCWPVGDPAETDGVQWSCCAATKVGEKYCPKHKTRSTRKAGEYE